MSIRVCRRKNPLNIRYSPRNKWKGQIGNSHGFCSFISMEYGLRAGIVLIRSYIRRGYNTINSIISRWAPPSENNTESYINFVVGRVGLPDDTEILDTDIEIIKKLIQAMSWIETMSVIDAEDLNHVINEYL